MSGRGSNTVSASAILVAGAVVGTAAWLWVKRRQLALAAAKALPREVSDGAAEQASAVAGAVPEQATEAAGAVSEQATEAAGAVPEQATAVTSPLPEQASAVTTPLSEQVSGVADDALPNQRPSAE